MTAGCFGTGHPGLGPGRTRWLWPLVMVAFLVASALVFPIVVSAATTPTAPQTPAAPVLPGQPSAPVTSPFGPTAPGTSNLAPTSLGPSAQVNAIVAEAMRHLPTERLDAVLQAVSRESGGAPVPSLGATVEALAQGKLPLTPASLLRLLTQDFAHEVAASAGLLGKLVVLAVGAALLELLGRAIGRDDAARLASTVVHLALVALALGSFTLAFALARGIVTDLDSLMEAVLPLMVTLLAAMGALTSAALFQPLVLAATEVVGHIVASVALPLLYVGGVLEVVGRITPYRLANVAALLRMAGLWVLGGVLTTFLGVIVVAGSLGPVSDGLTLKAGKFLANAFIPVVGKMFADATEMVMGTSLLLKNAVGAVGLVALLLMLVVPVTKLLAMSFTYRLAGAAVSPVGGGPVPDVLGAMGQTLVFVAVAVGAMAMMCFIAIAAMMAAGSAGVLP